MKTISWNCQGLNNALIVWVLKDLVVKYKPNVVFLCETKAIKDGLLYIARKIRMECYFIVEAHNG